MRKHPIILATVGGFSAIILASGAIVALTYGLAASAQFAANRWGIKFLESVDRRILAVIAAAIVCGTFSFLIRGWSRNARRGSR